MRAPDKLYREVRMSGRSTVEVTLTRCRNCGKVKVTSDPCSFDHLAAILEWNADRAAA